jgi:hypothetical protein
MNAPDEYCELCDLPKSQCPHGQPPPAPVEAAVPKPAPRKRPATRARPAAPEKLVTRRWSSPDVFKPLILTLLERAGGELETEDLLRELEVVAADRLLPEDSDTTPEGELRWRYAARRARMALIKDGLMTKGRPGVWQLARPGRHPG